MAIITRSKKQVLKLLNINKARYNKKKYMTSELLHEFVQHFLKKKNPLKKFQLQVIKRKIVLQIQMGGKCVGGKRCFRLLKKKNRNLPKGIRFSKLITE